MRTLIRTVSIILGLLWIGVTLSGKAEYGTFDSPLINLGIGAALIFTPGGTLVMLLGYFLIIAIFVISSVLGASIGSLFLGKFGLCLGFIAGVIGGSWFIVNSKMVDWAGKLKAWVDEEK